MWYCPIHHLLRYTEKTNLLHLYQLCNGRPFFMLLILQTKKEKKKNTSHPSSGPSMPRKMQILKKIIQNVLFCSIPHEACYEGTGILRNPSITEQELHVNTYINTSPFNNVHLKGHNLLNSISLWTKLQSFSTNQKLLNMHINHIWISSISLSQAQGMISIIQGSQARVFAHFSHLNAKNRNILNSLLERYLVFFPEGTEFKIMA